MAWEEGTASIWPALCLFLFLFFIIILSCSPPPYGVLEPSRAALPPCLRSSCTWYTVHATLCPCTFGVSLASISFQSAFHSHPSVPWWSFLVAGVLYQLAGTHASTSRWGHTLRAATRPASVETLPPPCCQTHAILAVCFSPVFPFPDRELGLYPGKPRTASRISH